MTERLQKLLKNHLVFRLMIKADVFKKQEEKLRKSGLKGAPAFIDPGKCGIYNYIHD